MAIRDGQDTFSDSQALTAAAASTNYKNHQAVRNMGIGNELYIQTTIEVALTDAGSNSTVTVDLQRDDNTSFSSATTVATLYTIAAVAAAGTTYEARVPIDTSLPAGEWYYRIYYTMNNGDLSTGTVTTAIMANIRKYVAYAKNYVVSSTNQF